MPCGDGELSGEDPSWPPQSPHHLAPTPNLLANEGCEGLHLQGGAHDDEQIHLQEVL